MMCRQSNVIELYPNRLKPERKLIRTYHSKDAHRICLGQYYFVIKRSPMLFSERYGHSIFHNIPLTKWRFQFGCSS